MIFVGLNQGEGREWHRSLDPKAWTPSSVSFSISFETGHKTPWSKCTCIASIVFWVSLVLKMIALFICNMPYFRKCACVNGLSWAKTERRLWQWCAQ